MLVAVVHQRQAHHAVLGIDAEIADQAMRVKVAVFGADSGILQLMRQRLGTLLQRFEGNGRGAIVVAGVGFADQAQIGVLQGNREWVRPVRFRGAVSTRAYPAVVRCGLVRFAEMMLMQIVEVIQHAGAGRNLRVLRSGRD